MAHASLGGQYAWMAGGSKHQFLDKSVELRVHHLAWKSTMSVDSRVVVEVIVAHVLWLYEDLLQIPVPCQACPCVFALIITIAILK